MISCSINDRVYTHTFYFNVRLFYFLLNKIDVAFDYEQYIAIDVKRVSFFVDSFEF